jgi:hypothetical protein
MTMRRFTILSAWAAAIPLIAASAAANAAVCTEQYAPVCARAGSIAKTYSNRCFAHAEGAKVIAEGACRSASGGKIPK